MPFYNFLQKIFNCLRSYSTLKIRGGHLVYDLSYQLDDKVLQCPTLEDLALYLVPALDLDSSFLLRQILMQLGPCHSGGIPSLNSCLLVSAQASPDCCRHLGSELVNGSYLSVFLSLSFLSLSISASQINK